MLDRKVIEVTEKQFNYLAGAKNSIQNLNSQIGLLQQLVQSQDSAVSQVMEALGAAAELSWTMDKVDGKYCLVQVSEGGGRDR